VIRPFYHFISIRIDLVTYLSKVVETLKRYLSFVK